MVRAIRAAWDRLRYPPLYVHHDGFIYRPRLWGLLRPKSLGRFEELDLTVKEIP